MGHIQLLDTKTINKIAAGEVVESPKSVVKELVENSIDAGATSITVEIKEGGTSLIRITDNGSGIPKEEVKTAFLRHATSKMSQIEDLEEIFTLGFRGEALASIAAVAQVDMLTKTADADLGIAIEVSGGELKEMKDAAATQGTSISVKNLFYNVPARRKFLKKPATESGNVSALMNQFALGHPEISFRYINNGTTMLHSSGNGDWKTAIFYVYGKEVANGMIPISYTKDGYTIKGLIGKPELSRGNRTYENLFINGRYIKNGIVSSAVEDAYKTRLMVGKFPVFLLHLSIHPSEVDVNVHPAKLEVRFKNDNEIYELFYNAIQKTLEKEIFIPKVSWDKKETAKDKPILPKVEQQNLGSILEIVKEFAQEGMVEAQKAETKATNDVAKEIPNPVQPKLERYAPATGGGKSVDQLLGKKTVPENRVMQDKTPYTAKTPVELPKSVELAEKPVTQPVVAKQEAKEPENRKAFFNQYKIVGQIFRTYWMVEQGDSMYLIDQHAAHERVLYEEFMGKLQKEPVVSQRLLSPLMLHLTESEIAVMKENKDLLQEFGFEVEQFTEKVYALQSVPYMFHEPSGVGFFTEILDELAEQKVHSVYEQKYMSVATMACKAAVKGHDSLSYQEAEALIGQLLKLENPFSCPHGRPTIIEMTKYELEKKFKRIQN
ncbi:DNA mismatch repair endonuclease MutL [Chakrabartyella piscis]|uniref:DNA mismatch repair endonuclease MutL n=1 Tax=Chakrabartyella piscis TaxID=2918914 RepID=UPI0029584E1C|nr:DNA mismatch repair endonuclease MutL [Chakrabartyella piscis]